MTTTSSTTSQAQLACAHFPTVLDDRAPIVDRARRGAVCSRGPAGTMRRAEPGPCGPLVLEARPGRGAEVSVWGDPSTPADVVEASLEAAIAWAGLRDRPDPLGEMVDAHPVLRHARMVLGEVRLSVLPRVGEAVGRAVLAQLVQSVEAHRSTAQVAARAGSAAPGSLWAWPRARRMGAMPSWELRRCGVSGRGARALHAAAIEDARLEACRDDTAQLDARLRSLPGIGAWTSAEVRFALGDPDAVSLGDYNLPGLVGHVLAGDATIDDSGMVELLAPYTGQRGRVIALIDRAVAARVVPGPKRTAPRAALSAHRYW